MTSTSLRELPCLKELEGGENDSKIGSEAVEKILNELLMELDKSQDELESTRKRNLPKIEEIKREKREIAKEITRIKEEFREMNEVKPVATIEKRRSDFKTEREYIDKILNRNIQEEFLNQMKRELKYLSNSLSESPESLDQIISSVPGCDEINEKLDEKGIEGLPISQKTEKLLSTISKCNWEISKKVYPTAKDKCDAFKLFCCEVISEYFQKRIKKNVIGSSGVTSLPQFTALLLNDLSMSVTFIKVQYSKTEAAASTAQFLQEMRKSYYEKFLTEQKEEISNLFCSSDDQPRNMKKITIFLNRLEKVSISTMLKTDLINLKLSLVNFVHKLVWERLRNASDIAEEEIEGLMSLISATLIVNVSSTAATYPLFYKPKLQDALKLLQSSLIEIINSYHRQEYRNLTWWELEGFIGAIFASSPLRNEFIREIRLSDGDDEEEEYF